MQRAHNDEYPEQLFRTKKQHDTLLVNQSRWPSDKNPNQQIEINRIRRLPHQMQLEAAQPIELHAEAQRPQQIRIVVPVARGPLQCAAHLSHQIIERRLENLHAELAQEQPLQRIVWLWLENRNYEQFVSSFFLLIKTDDEDEHNRSNVFEHFVVVAIVFAFFLTAH